MAYLIGLVLALAVSAYATMLRLDRDGAFYPTVLVVVASYYILFAAIGEGAGGYERVILIESLIAGVFVVGCRVAIGPRARTARSDCHRGLLSGSVYRRARPPSHYESARRLF